CRMRGGAATFPFQNGNAGARPFRRGLGAGLALGQVASSFLAGFGALSFARSRQIDAGAARLGQTDRNRLFRIACAMLTLTHMMHFLPYEFSGLRRGRFAFALILL